jgi:hypothetical protein
MEEGLLVTTLLQEERKKLLIDIVNQLYSSLMDASGSESLASVIHLAQIFQLFLYQKISILIGSGFSAYSSVVTVDVGCVFY